MKQSQSKEDSIYAAYLISFFAVVFYVIMGPLFGNGTIWYLVVLAIAAAAGYFADRKNPIPYIAGCISFILIFPLAYEFYFSGRDSFINIEIAIPILISAAPALIVQWIIYKLVEGRR